MSLNLPIVAGVVAVISAIGTWAAALNGWIPTYARDIISDVSVLLISAFAAANLRAIVALFQRATQKTDKQLIGDWHVYRFGCKNGNEDWLASQWLIRRTMFTRKYLIYDRRPWPRVAMRGEVTFKERDRVIMSLTGIDHKQQFSVAFQPTIPMRDTRMIGIGVGDDSDYLLSGRIYLASRVALPEDHAKAVITDATKLFANTSGNLLQLSIVSIAEILSRHEAPARETAAPDYSLRRRISDLLAYLSDRIRPHQR